MHEASQERVDGFLRDLGEALGRSGHQARQVVDEVRADLEAHLERLRVDGVEEDEAVRRALDELGNPFELAHRMRPQIPPFGGPAATALRYLAASGVIGWALLLLWSIRAWSYGFQPTTSGFVILFHLPVVLLLWPRIVWRRNWLFASGIAALAVVVAIGLAMGGIRSTSVHEVLVMTEEGVATPPPLEVPVDEDERSRLPWFLAGSGLAGIAVLLLAAMQRRGQRRLALLAALVGAGAVEVAFQAEEWRFRSEVAQVRGYVETVVRDRGALPAHEELVAEGPGSWSPHVRVRGTPEDWSLFWARPLSPSASLIYSSADGSVVAQD